MKNVFVFLFIIFAFWGCENSQTKQSDSTTDEHLKVFAVNYPLLYFAERIGGEYVDLIYPIPGDVDPAYWVPNDALEEIQKADLILSNGADYAKWMEKVSLPSSKLVNTSKASKDKYIKFEIGDTHSHGADGKHVHYGYAFTTWLDFKIALDQAEAVKNALIDKRPKHKAVFQSNFDALKIDLLELDRRMQLAAENLPDIAVFASHPVYQYLGQAYGIEIVSEHWEPGVEPSEKQWSEFEHNLDHHPANLMLWEGVPSAETVQKLNGVIVTSVLFNPCGNTPQSGDFISVMKQNLKNLEKYIEESS